MNTKPRPAPPGGALQYEHTLNPAAAAITDPDRAGYDMPAFLTQVVRQRRWETTAEARPGRSRECCTTGSPARWPARSPQPPGLQAPAGRHRGLPRGTVPFRAPASQEDGRRVPHEVKLAAAGTGRTFAFDSPWLGAPAPRGPRLASPDRQPGRPRARAWDLARISGQIQLKPP
jgi:hypothetical protein